jgi:hypothetical protein
MPETIKTFPRHQLLTLSNNSLQEAAVETNPYPEFIKNIFTYTKFTKKELYNFCKLINFNKPLDIFCPQDFILMADLTTDKNSKFLYINLTKNTNLISLIQKQIRNNFKSYFKNNKFLMTVRFTNITVSAFQINLHFYIPQKNKLFKFKVKQYCDINLESINKLCNNVCLNLKRELQLGDNK